MIGSSYGKKINLIYKFKGHERHTLVEKSTSLKELKEKIEKEINFSLSKMKLISNGSNILLNNENYKIHDFFGDVKSITLEVQPQEFSEESYISQFEKAFKCINNNTQNVEPEEEKKNDVGTSYKKLNAPYLKKNVQLDSNFSNIKNKPVCNQDAINEASYICIKCRLYWCRHCIKFEVHKSDLVELDFLDTFLNINRTNYSKDIDEGVCSDTLYPHLEKIDYILNEKISAIEKQFKDMVDLINKIKESQVKYLIDLFYQQVDNKQFKTITHDVQYFKNKLLEVKNTYNKDKIDDNLNNHEVLGKFKDLIKQNYSEFKFKYTTYFNIFSQYESFNSTFCSQIEAKFKQSNSMRSSISKPEELNKITKEEQILKKDLNLSKKSSYLLKMKYYNTILQWDHGKQSLTKIKDFTDRFEFKLNYQVYSGNIFLNHNSRLFIVTGVNFNMCYFYDRETNEIFKLPNLSENHSRGALVYSEKLNSFICLGGKYSNKCEKFDLKFFSFPNPDIHKTIPFDYTNNKELSWSDFPPLIYQRHSTAYFIYNNTTLYAFFGYLSNRGSTDIIEKINLENPINWEIVQYSNTKYLDLKLSSQGCVYANNDEVYILGGCIESNNKFTDKIFKYNFVQNAIFLTEMKIPGIKENEYFRFWEESCFKALSSFGHIFNNDDDFTFGVFDARDKLHIFNSRSFKYNII
jgi:hypothetical protein